MVEIVRGELIRTDVNPKAMGGTELIAHGLADRLPIGLLKRCQIIHSRPRELQDDLVKILVCHDLPGDPEVKHLQNGGWAKYDHIVFVSNWQMEKYNMILGVPYSHCSVIPNAIVPLDYRAEKKYDKIRLIYHSTPHRGLNILNSVFQDIVLDFPDIHLDVFSSFKLYGWEKRDEPFKPLFDSLKNHSHITYHGTASNDVVRAAISKADIFAYPSTWMETSCLCLIEALSAGLLPVIPNYAALPETSRGFGLTYQWQEDPDTHGDVLYDTLWEAIQLVSDGYDSRVQRETINNQHNWDNVIDKWIRVLESVVYKVDMR